MASSGLNMDLPSHVHTHTETHNFLHLFIKGTMTTKLSTDMIISLLGLPLLLQVILPGISSPMHLPPLLHLEGILR